ncbi:hypothetical protein ACS2MN_30030, partial [Bacillus cereus group sp. BceL062]|uniref:hypothetical protein n=1 Tax=Bacillus cereus group sp. BceL062 TaxID=3445166 RepID=UPI003F24A7B8
KKDLIWANFQDENGKDCTATIQSGNFNLGIDTESGLVFLDCKQITWSVIEGITYSLDYKENFTIGKTDKNQIKFTPKKNSLQSDLSIQVSKAYQTREFVKESIADIGFSILGGFVGGMFGEAIGGFAEVVFKSLGKIITGAVETAIKTGSATIRNIFSKLDTVPLDELIEADSSVIREETTGQKNRFGIREDFTFLSDEDYDIMNEATIRARSWVSLSDNDSIDKILEDEILEITGGGTRENGENGNKDKAFPDSIDEGIEDEELDKWEEIIDKLHQSRQKKVNPVMKFIQTRWKLALGVSLGGALGGGIGEGLAKLDQWVDFKKEDPFQNLPTLDTFLNKCMENVKWPQSSGFQFKSIELTVGGLRINGELIPKTKNS